MEGGDILVNNEKRNISVIKDADGKNIVFINDIRFKGKRSVNWNDVKEYLEEYRKWNT